MTVTKIINLFGNVVTDKRFWDTCGERYGSVETSNRITQLIKILKMLKVLKVPNFFKNLKVHYWLCVVEKHEVQIFWINEFWNSSQELIYMLLQCKKRLNFVAKAFSRFFLSTPFVCNRNCWFISSFRFFLLATL